MTSVLTKQLDHIFSLMHATGRCQASRDSAMENADPSQRAGVVSFSQNCIFNLWCFSCLIDVTTCMPRMMCRRRSK